MIPLLLSLLLAAPPCPHPHRSSTARARFMRAKPCPGGPDKGSTKRCAGFVVDHIISLACCGPDAPCNMRWMHVADAKKKDRWENNCSVARKRVRNSCGSSTRR
jgi:hypothetical protein